MAEDRGDGLLLKKPVGVLHRELNLDFKDFLKALGGGIISGAIGNVGWIATNALNAIGALSKKDDPGMMAYQLIYRSMLAAMAIAAADYRKHLIGLDDVDTEKLAKEFSSALEEKEIRIEIGFFDNPRGLEFLEDAAGLYREWLVGLHIEESRLYGAVHAFKSEFVFAVDQEWGAHGADYEIVRKAVDSPFTRSKDEERVWIWYRDYLDHTLHEPLFGQETFCVEDVFVPLRAYFEHEHRKANPRTGRISAGDRLGDEEQIIRIPVWLQDRLREWACDRRDDCPSLMVLAGGPGSGKSTSAKIFARDMLRAGLRTLFLPLHRFDMDGKIENRIQTYVERLNPTFSDTVKTASINDPLLLIFDGLDELPEQGRVAVQNARNLIKLLNDLLDTMNQAGTRIKALVTGRKVALEATVLEGFDRAQCLHLEDYFIPNEDRRKYISDGDILEVDQRDIWWEKYGRASGIGHEALPESLKKGGRLEELTSQPILNYLIALLYDDPEVKIDFELGLNMAEVYHHLLEQVYRRVWGGKDQARQATIEHISWEDFLKVMQEIALAAWHGSGRLVTLEKVEECCLWSGSKDLARLVAKGAEESGALNLLTAFYFRKHGPQSGQETFEFTHKSFQEYLTASKIVEKIKELYKHLQGKSYPPSDDVVFALEKWIKTGGPTAMDDNLYGFIKDLIVLEKRVGGDIVGFQTMLGRLAGYTVVFGMPLDKTQLKFKEMLRQARNSGEALLICLFACALATGKLSDIDWPGMERRSIGEWLYFLIGKPGAQTAATNYLGLLNLSMVDLQHLYLVDVFLWRASLYKADLRYSDLIEANLNGTNLSRANLSEAILSEADLSRADLSGANLSGADLIGADLIGTDLSGADLREVYLREADLSGAYLSGAHLKGADLREVDLRGAYLMGADLRMANLSGADLEGADLRGTDFTGAIIDQQTNFTDVKTNKLFGLDPKWLERKTEETEEGIIDSDES